MLSKFFGKNSRPDLSRPEAEVTQPPVSPPAAAQDDSGLDLLSARWDPTPGKPSAAGAAHGGGFDKTIPAPLVDVAGAGMDPKARTLEQRKNDALAVVDGFHHRIANTIRTMWGYPECSAYINKLIMAGGDGMGHQRVGFNQEAVHAMLELADLHDQEFGPPDVSLQGSGPMRPLR